VLEIGCGTGSSTVALAEQGAAVTAVDLDARVLDVARARCAEHGVEARFLALNASDVARKLAGEPFDLLIFFASLEHMTLGERLDAMRETWDLLAPGALWCVTDTPNRLWYFDEHTARLPFFQWLPDELAFRYARFSPRAFFGDVLGEHDAASELAFLRLGRGVSHHEFDLALAPAETLDVVSSLPLFHRARRPGHRLRRWHHRKRLPVRWEALLAEIRPDLHRGFFQPSLDLLIRKPG
jgi:S-adenosylmethionine-dependent methyltransferase